MLKIAICDDERALCRQIHGMLDRHERSAEFLISEFSSGEDLCQALKNEDYFDLIILDIEFPGISGVEVGSFLRQTLKDAMTQILYISGKAGYERQLFEFRPLNFLPKPVSERKLWKCIDTAMEMMNREFPCLQFVYDRVVHRLPFRDICYLESYEKRITVHGVRDRKHFLGKLAALELPDYFIQIHQSYIVNYVYVKSIQYDCVVLYNGKELPISRTWRKSVREFMLRTDIF